MSSQPHAWHNVTFIDSLSCCMPSTSVWADCTTDQYVATPKLVTHSSQGGEWTTVEWLKFAVDLKPWRIMTRIPDISATDNGNEKVATV